jgi:hypothetical protein
MPTNRAAVPVRPLMRNMRSLAMNDFLRTGFHIVHFFPIFSHLILFLFP